MKSPTLPLHEAQIVRLESYTDYTVYDANPENAEYPYIVMGGIDARDWSDKSEPGMEVYSTIHVWSQYHGRKEADEIADAVIQALSSSILVLSSDFLCSLARLDSYNLMVDIDGKTRHGIVRLKYLIEEPQS